MADVGDAFIVPQFLEAQDKVKLVRAMLLNNLKHGMEFDYFGIQKDKNVWIAWYRFPMDRSAIIMEQLDNG